MDRLAQYMLQTRQTSARGLSAGLIFVFSGFVQSGISTGTLVSKWLGPLHEKTILFRSRSARCDIKN